MSGIKIKSKRKFFESLSSVIEVLSCYNYIDDTDKLAMASLAEIKKRLDVMLVTVKKEYTITLTDAQSIAIRILYTDFIQDFKSYVGNKLHTISNQVKQKYQ